MKLWPLVPGVSPGLHQAVFKGADALRGPGIALLLTHFLGWESAGLTAAKQHVSILGVCKLP